jgi:hypothetical protein
MKCFVNYKKYRNGLNNDGWYWLPQGLLNTQWLTECCVCLRHACTTWEVPGCGVSVPFCDKCVLVYKKRYHSFCIGSCICLALISAATLLFADGQLNERFIQSLGVSGGLMIIFYLLWRMLGPPYKLRGGVRGSDEQWIKFKNPRYPSLEMSQGRHP